LDDQEGVDGCTSLLSPKRGGKIGGKDKSKHLNLSNRMFIVSQNQYQTESRMEKLDEWSLSFYMSKRILVATIFVLLAVNLFEMHYRQT
jgi:hypothetical protein